MTSLVAAQAWAQDAPAAAATELLCAMRTGDVVATLRVAAGRDPLAAQRVEVGERFEVQALALAAPATPGQVAQAVVSVVDRESGDRPQTVAQGRWWPTAADTLAPDGEWQPRLTGWQRVYTPRLGRELAWGCAVVWAGETPSGWDQADATGPAEKAGLSPLQGVGVAASAARPAGEVRLVWMGDVMLADGPGRVIAKGGDPFQRVAALLAQADVRIANLECVVSTRGKALDKPWTFRARPETLAVLRRHVDVVSLANNHSGDYGPDAFADMLGRLDRAGLPYFGGGTDLRAAYRPRIIERAGLRIALLGFDEMFPRAFEATVDSAGIAWADEERVVDAIRAARAQADVVIPYMHWGQEHSAVAHARQRALARRMLQAGAAAVVGTHPHVRQDDEVIEGRPVVYSLGNFVFDGFSDADNNTGSLLWMTVTAQGVRDWKLQPVRIDKQGRPAPLDAVQ